ncbi:hypothetical protein GCM10025734_36640 [Kitasatospora paranensis]
MRRAPHRAAAPGAHRRPHRTRQGASAAGKPCGIIGGTGRRAARAPRTSTAGTRAPGGTLTDEKEWLTR